MARFCSIYLAIALVMLPLDAIWLSVMASRLYRPQIGPLLRESFDPLAAVLFYLIFLAGLATFVGVPSWDSVRWTDTLWRGALFGLVAYATYDLTNQASVRGWSWLVTAADLAWGTALCGVSSALGIALARKIVRLF